MHKRFIYLGVLLIASFVGLCLTDLAADPPQNAVAPQVVNPVSPAAADPDFDAEKQVWQGRVVEAREGKLKLRIEGEPQSFEVAPDADIRKNRRPSELGRLAPRDFATVVSVGGERGERVIRIRAYSMR